MNDWQISLIKMLNGFCFSKRHDHYCNGCIFKNCSNCPLNTVVKKLEKSYFRTRF